MKPILLINFLLIYSIAVVDYAALSIYIKKSAKTEIDLGRVRQVGNAIIAIIVAMYSLLVLWLDTLTWHWSLVFAAWGLFDLGLSFRAIIKWRSINAKP